MPRQYHLLLYQPTTTAINHAENHGELQAEWTNNNTTELLYELDAPFYNNSPLRDALREELQSDNDMVANSSRPSQIREIIESEKTVYDQLIIEDFLPNHHPELREILTTISPGGDLRKYIDTIYGKRFTINFGLGRSKDTTITAMEPFPTEYIQPLIDLNVASDDYQENSYPYYPEPKRILKWTDLVQDEWGLECAGNATMIFPRDVSELPKLVFDGFIIFDAEEPVNDWCNKRWLAVDSYADKEQLLPFMLPDEYNFYKTSETDSSIPRNAIRMWWD